MPRNEVPMIVGVADLKSRRVTMRLRTAEGKLAVSNLDEAAQAT
jgi:hypothetical protein